MLIIPPILTVGSSLKSSAMLAAVTGAWFVAQTTADPVAAPILEKMAREGGFFALVLVVLYFYRRDTKWATEFWRDQATRNTDMIEENAKQAESVAAAIRESTVVMHAAKNIMARQLRNSPHREEDTP